MDLFDRLQNVDAFPSPSGVALRVLELARRDDVSLREVADVVGADPALSARVLRYVNSPLLGFSGQVATIGHAVSLIGLRGVKLLALGFSLVSPEHASTVRGFGYHEFWSRSLGTAVAARLLARRTDLYDPEEAFVAGLLCRIGQLALAVAAPSRYEEVLRVAQREGLADIERALLGLSHLEVSARLLASWHLPRAICVAVESMGSVVPRSSAEPPGLAEIVYTADLASRLLDEDADPPRSLDRLLEATRVFFGWDEAATGAAFDEIARERREMGAILSLEVPPGRPFHEIQAEAARRMAELTLALQLENEVLRQRQRELLRLATLDPLTGAANRAAFEARLRLELERARRTQRPLALILLDIDGFKRFNDDWGHAAGDRVLCEVARALSLRTRKVDLVARYGGEEFAIIAPEVGGPDGAALIAERVRRTVEETSVEWEGRVLAVTASVGAALAAWPGRERTPEQLTAAADAQLYAAKRAGRNRCCVEG